MFNKHDNREKSEPIGTGRKYRKITELSARSISHDIRRCNFRPASPIPPPDYFPISLFPNEIYLGSSLHQFVLLSSVILIYPSTTGFLPRRCPACHRSGRRRRVKSICPVFCPDRRAVISIARNFRLHGQFVFVRMSPPPPDVSMTSRKPSSRLIASSSVKICLAGVTAQLTDMFQVRYTGYRDRPIHERQNKFLNAARDGSTEIVSESETAAVAAAPNLSSCRHSSPPAST